MTVGKSLEMATFSRILSANWTGESVPLYAADELCRPFLLRSHWQSGFHGSARRMPCDHKSMMWRKPVDFFVLPREPFESVLNP